MTSPAAYPWAQESGCDVEEHLDDWSRDEWWRAQNPGASLMRGLLCALPVAAVMWLAMAVAVWLIFSL